jgi:hypothetical protein
LKHYPPGVPADVDVTQYRSLPALLDDSFRKFAERDAFVFMEHALTYAERFEPDAVVDLAIGIEQAGSGFSAMTICSPRWFVDGVDFGKLPGDEQRSLLIRAVRIEIYRASLAPPQFNDFDGCGVVVVWTR